MNCGFCGSRIGEGEHRCRRCGRKPGDTLIHTEGALAAKPQRIAQIELDDSAERPLPRPALPRPVQGSLFQAPSNIIPIERYAPPIGRPRPRAEAGARSVIKSPSVPKPAAKPVRRTRVPEEQGSLDFLPAALPKARTLSTTVEAVIYCDAPVATRVHRAVAALLDWSMVLIAYGAFLVFFYLCGGEIILTNKTNLAAFGAMLPLIGITYGLVFAIAGTETPGMRWTQLRLVTFDGFPPEQRHRLFRFAGSCLSLCTVIGLLWSLADEECLTWQDHMSRTFPTPWALDSQIIQRR